MTEVRDMGAAAGDAAATVTGRIEALHKAIANRAFPPGAAGPKLVHDVIAGGVYGGIRTGLPWAGRGVAVAARLAGAPKTPISNSPKGRAFIGAINGAWGDQLEANYAGLAIQTAIRVDGKDVPLTAEGLRKAFPHAQPRVVIFLHGLCETEEAWGPSDLTFGARLERLHPVTSLQIRYNSGLPIAESGRRFAALMDQLVLAWPTQLTSISIVGHSMGGLVARAACPHGAPAWTERVHHLISLGTPHSGARLAQGATVAATALRWFPESTPVADLLDSRSEGVKDLRNVAPDDLLVSAKHFAISASLGETDSHLLSRMFGDLLVHDTSACAGVVEISEDSVHRIGRLNHFGLLRDPRVFRQLERWLMARPATQRKALPAGRRRALPRRSRWGYRAD